ncbi:hypothetical protein VTN00DRAFT_10294 [Thermoascus crustaceus]|uniref:uncharacterized protein n=1 Tax=Thermoascus crustaceus TaxID=5088 RepID=UPI00374362D9
MELAKREERLSCSKSNTPVELLSQSPLSQRYLPPHGPASSMHTPPPNDYLCESAATEVVEMEGEMSNGLDEWPYYYFSSPSRNNHRSHNHNSQNVSQLSPLSQQPLESHAINVHININIHHLDSSSIARYPGVRRSYLGAVNNNNRRAVPLSPLELDLGPAPVYTPPADGRRYGDGIDGFEKSQVTG